MAYAPIAKLEKFTSEKDNAQVWLNNVEKAIFLKYFSNNNSINRLANTFTTIKQRENKAFIHGLHNSILQCVCPLHPINLQTAIINARDFEATELKANHAQAINLIMNESSELNFKLKQFSDFINQKLEEYLANNRTIY
ncbi:hypothetical protein G9A89_006595 [Geosiphon pyriformis]|nr:hypothetical protein G9A89_006595 [Geosiphon pyriformis]